MKVTTLIKLTAFSLVSSLSFAALPPMPASCPSTTSIIDAGLMFAQRDKSGIYLAVGGGTYKTHAHWGVVMAMPAESAESLAQALAHADFVLPSLTGNPSPVVMDGEPNKWMCRYNELPGGYQLIAFEPFVDLDKTSVMKFVR